MSGRNLPLHCILTLVAMQGHPTNKTKTKETMSLDYSSICYIGSRTGWVSTKETYKSWMDVEMIIKTCPITIPMVHTYKSNYGVEIEGTCIISLAKSGPTHQSFFTVLLFVIHTSGNGGIYLFFGG